MIKTFFKAGKTKTSEKTLAIFLSTLTVSLKYGTLRSLIDLHTVPFKNSQARRHGGAFQGRATQMTACAPPNEYCAPKRGLRPEEIHRFGAIEVQIEA